EAVEPAEDPAAERIGDILVDSGSADRTDVEIAATEQELGDDRQLGTILVDEGRAEPQAVEKAAASQRSAADSTIRVDVSVLDTLMNLVGELVLSRNQLMQLASTASNKDFAAPAQRLNLITSELQEGVMKTRMQPIGHVWNKLPRVVRDLSHQFGKQIRLELEGKDTELDRTILEAIKDPLTHMVRNTADHGIENPEERVAAGKDPEGVLKLSATHEGGQVNIEISDDGKGIDADTMRRKAIDKGVIS
ncbi:MAG: chemotaxis protein CheA, partial [Actinomycetia bacterium]|nr:chemotaxis protein CheA [Actinomycetes bacterium]